jgi:hypothetical protein
MIIVSQDRKQIVNHDNVTRIFIENLENGEFGIGADTNSAESHVWDLGCYKTEERAEKVLEEIIKTYLSYASVKNLTGDIKSIHTIPSAYVMPKE